MDKQAFKQRMQNLKSYRENNPGKGYWDWRNSLPDNLKYTDDTEYNMRGAYESGAQPILENDGFYHLPTRNPQTGEILKTSLHPTFWKGLAEDAKIGYNTYFVGDKVYTKSKEEGPINVYADGGEVARKSLKDIRKESIIEDKLDYDVMLQNQNAYQKEFATNWYKERAKNPKYSSQLGDGKLDKILSDIDKATWKNPTEAMRDNLISQGYTPTDQNIKSQLQAINAKGTKGFAVPSMYSYYGAPRNTWHEGVGHIVGDNNPAILDSTPNINIPSNDPQYSDYVNQANEKHAQTWDFRGKNQTLKDDTGNYYIDPNRQLSSDDIQEMIDKGAAIPDQWKDITTQDISDLTNTFAYNYAEGGEVGNPDDDFTKAINTKLGRTPDGRPKEQGLKPVFDLEDAANITPIQKASLKKTNDVKDDYFKLGTEQKAYMNQLRTRMYNDKAISSLEEPVSTALIKKYMDSLGDKDSIKRAYKQHKSLSAYTKWFNSIPLLGIGAIGVNKYFNNGIEQEK